MENQNENKSSKGGCGAVVGIIIVLGLGVLCFIGGFKACSGDPVQWTQGQP